MEGALSERTWMKIGQVSEKQLRARKIVREKHRGVEEAIEVWRLYAL